MGIRQAIQSFWKSKKPGAADRPLQEFQEKIKYAFNDVNLLRMALTHRSLARAGEGDQMPSNERLEFLGDSVLGLIVAEYLYNRYPEKSEGGLTKLKSLLVNETTLFRTSEKLELGRFLLLSQEEEKAGGRSRVSINADTLEAVIGAVYLDGGLAAVQPLVSRYILSQMDAIVADESFRNYKGDLLEYLQAGGNGMPRYEVISEEGPDHDKVFTVAVCSNGEEIGRGEGSSKKDAEQVAAAQAMKRLKGN
jgi:ribonuclease-3